MEENKTSSKMTTLEWILVILVCLIVDIVQIVLVLLFGAGLIINRIINIVFAAVFAYYLSKRGVSILRGSQLIVFLSTFGVEEIGIGDFLPTWTIDAIFTWLTTKSTIVAKSASRLQKISNVASAAKQPLNINGTRAAAGTMELNADGVRPPRGGLSTGNK